MIRKLNSFIVLLFILSPYGSPANQALKSLAIGKQKLSSVELQWEDSPGAFMYEVEVSNSKGKRLKSFTSKSSLFQFKSTSGKIKIRGRIIDAYGKRGLWSEVTSIEVPPDDLKFSENPENQKPISANASSSNSKGKVALSWPETVQARRYLVKILDKDDKVIQQKETMNLNEKFELPVGAYSFSVTPIGIDHVVGKEVRAPQKIQIGSAQLSTEKFQLAKKDEPLNIKMPKRNNFEIYGALEYAYHLSEVWTPVLNYTPFADDIWTPTDKLKPGRYRISFWTSRKNWIDSDKFYHEFVVKPTEAEIAAAQ